MDGQAARSDGRLDAARLAYCWFAIRLGLGDSGALIAHERESCGPGYVWIRTGSPTPLSNRQVGAG